MRRIAAVTFALFVSMAAVGQEDQRPRPPVKDERGLLKVDPLYYNMAAATGGDIYFWAAGEFVTAKLRVPVERDPVVLSYGTAAGKNVFEIPIETGVAELTLFVAIQRKDLAVIVWPDGTVAAQGQKGVDLQPFQHMLIATIAAPAAGAWRLELDGAGLYVVTAHVKSDGPQLIDFKFVEPGGRPGHEGMFPIQRDPRPEESITCTVNLSASVRDPRLEFVTADGSPIRSFALTKIDDEEYESRCVVPSQPFRVRVQGSDGNGARFQRMESRTHTPK